MKGIHITALHVAAALDFNGFEPNSLLITCLDRPALYFDQRNPTNILLLTGVVFLGVFFCGGGYFNQAFW